MDGARHQDGGTSPVVEPDALPAPDKDCLVIDIADYLAWFRLSSIDIADYPSAKYT